MVFWCQRETIPIGIQDGNISCGPDKEELSGADSRKACQKKR